MTMCAYMSCKICFKCKVEKPFAEFYKHSGMNDGHLGKCKECAKSDVKNNYRKNIDHYKDYEKKRANLPHRVEVRERYAQTDAGINSIKKSKEKWNSSNPIKKKAISMVGSAVRDGRLAKPYSCENCYGKVERLHGHHDDYTKPLDVRWLCSKCHVGWHLDNGEGKVA